MKMNKYFKAWGKILDYLLIGNFNAKEFHSEGGSKALMEELVQRATPKKPDYEGDGYADGYMVYDTWICPCCDKRYEVDYDDYDYCPNCGQAIDWSKEDD